MNLHDIIEAAAEESNGVLPDWEYTLIWVRQMPPQHADCVRHIATFDPTLTAAMLAVCEAAGDSEAWTFAEGRPMHLALCALESLLTERGLTMGGTDD